MKKVILVIFAVLLLCTVGCVDMEDTAGVIMINNGLGVDLVDIRVYMSDESREGEVFTDTISSGKSLQLLWSDICDTSEGVLDIVVYDGAGNAYIFSEIKLYDGVEVSLIADGNSLYAEFDENGTLVRHNGAYQPYTPDDAPKNDYQGYWQYSYGVILEIEGEAWRWYNTEGDVINSGSFRLTEEGAELVHSDGSYIEGKLHFDEAGNLYDEEELLTKTDDLPFGCGGDGEENPLVGEWLHSDDGYILYFDADGSFTWSVDDGTLTGNYTFDGESVTLYYDASTSTVSYNDGKLFAEGDAGCFYSKNTDDAVG